MYNSLILSVVTFVYGLAAFFYLAAWVFHRPRLADIGTWTAVAAFAGNTAGILVRWVESYQVGYGHAPLSNLYESLAFFSWTIALIYLVTERKVGNKTIGAVSMPLAFFALAYASLGKGISSQIQPLIPALKSNWLIAHVVTCFISYAAFAVAFGLGILYLVRSSRPAGDGLRGRLPEPASLEELIHQMVLFGFVFLSAGIISGSVWANSAWGRYWGWDPKETWSLITWFVYAALLHARMMRGWQGRRVAWMAVVGFASVLFTYFGVNLLPGLHSYGSMSG